MPALADNELMLMFQKGNAHAFELLFEKYRRPLFNFIYRMLDGHRDAAEDLLQEIFIKVAKSRDFYEPRARFSTWLYTIARNHCINHLRSRRFLQAESTVSIDDQFIGHNGLAIKDATPDRTESGPVELDDLATQLETCIGMLPDAYKEVFLLRAVEGLSHHEVADILQLNPATARTHYLRARRLLQKHLRNYLGAECSEELEKSERHEEEKQ